MCPSDAGVTGSRAAGAGDARPLRTPGRAQARRFAGHYLWETDCRRFGKGPAFRCSAAE